MFCNKKKEEKKEDGNFIYCKSVDIVVLDKDNNPINKIKITKDDKSIGLFVKKYCEGGFYELSVNESYPGIRVNVPCFSAYIRPDDRMFMQSEIVFEEGEK